VLIRDAEIGWGRRRVDVRIEGARIVGLDTRLERRADDHVVDARGHALVPGLHDHHLHLYATAAAMRSLECGPPAVDDGDRLRRVIADADASGDGHWIRGTGYHESVAGSLDRATLDAWAPRHPLRVQHRSGRLWVFNSRGLERLGVRDDGNDPLERIEGRLTGRLYDADAWLRSRIGGQPPKLDALSRRLARLGVTGVTDTGHANDLAVFAAMKGNVASGELVQQLAVMGDASLDMAEPQAPDARVIRSAHKFHLHDHDLPDFSATCEAIRRSHAAGRAAAFHCVTRGELVFALAALGEAGTSGGDRIEHAGLVAPELIGELSRLRLRVVTQPQFVFERGDAYLRDVEVTEHAHLYRLRSFLDVRVPLAAGSDAPYGDPDPWKAMSSAVVRRTRAGEPMTPGESLTPEQALGLFMAPLDDPGASPREVRIGAWGGPVPARPSLVGCAHGAAPGRATDDADPRSRGLERRRVPLKEVGARSNAVPACRPPGTHRPLEQA
jgi:predicted amidohydrolase YtcJ